MRKIIFDFNSVETIEINSEEKSNIKKSVISKKDLYEYINHVMKNQKEKCGLDIHAVRKEKVKSQSVNEILDGKGMKEIDPSLTDVNTWIKTMCNGVISFK